MPSPAPTLSSTALNPQPAASAKFTIEALNQLRVEASTALANARNYLQQTFRNVQLPDGTKGGGWGQFLNEADKPPSSTGTAHGMLALIACGSPPDVETLVLASNFMASRQLSDGGWSKPSLEAKCGLTRITGLSLRALLQTGTHQSSPIARRAVQWLQAAQNKDGGWGNTASDEQSDVTSTSFSIQALAHLIGLDRAARESIRHAALWLEAARNPDFSWGEYKKQPGTVAHTSEALDGLRAVGHPLESLRQSDDWLRLHQRNAVQFSERYLITAGPAAHTSLTWTQVSTERGLITLLANGASPADPEVVASVRDILGRQQNGTYWHSTAFQNAAPIWAIKEATVAILGFIQSIDRNRASIVLETEISALRGQLNNITAEVAGIKEREDRRTWRYKRVALARLLRRRGILVAVATVLITVVYYLIRNSLHLPDYADILVAIAGFGGFFWGVTEAIRTDK